MQFLSTPRVLGYMVQKILGIRSEIESSDVVNHFNELLKWFHNCSTGVIERDVLKNIENIVLTVFQYMNSKPVIILDAFQRCICDKPYVWVKNKFLPPSCVSISWKTDGPYLYKLPENLLGFSTLVQHLGIKVKFTTETLVSVLNKMKSDYGQNSIPEECQDVFRLILPQLQTESVGTVQSVYLPDEEFVLRSTKDLKYNDAPWCDLDEDYVYCHECVERKAAINLGVEPVRSAWLQDLEDEEEEEEFGQWEDLTQRLNNILRDYPRDITFLKEILQNADDSGATKLYITLDKRKHNDKRVISEEWKELHGPALLFWNDSTFSKEDLLGIQKLGVGSKTVNASTIGQYGIGFSVVYHFTDCPSFITDGKLCILDPYRYYITHDKRKRPGKMYKNLEKLWQKFPDMKSSYLLNDSGEIPEEIKMKGSLFRLPLRQTTKHYKISEELIPVMALEKELKEWMSQVSEALLFLHNITDVKFFIIDEKESIDNLSWSRATLFHNVQSSKGKQRIIKQSQNGKEKLVSYPMTLITKENQITEWIVQLGEGNVEEEGFSWDNISPPNVACNPHHGIAAPVNIQKFMGRSFCYLPIPGMTGLPVHVHGHFILHSDRRGLWVSSSTRSVSTHDFKLQTVIPDFKALWNDFMIKVIGVSYAYLLIDLAVRMPPLVSRSMLLKSYYNYFPSLHIFTFSPWLDLIKNLYTILIQLNAPVLTKLARCSNTELKSQNVDSDDECSTVSWYKLLMPNSRNECFFNDKNLPIIEVLHSIGMNIVDTPMFVYEVFKKIDKNIKLSVVSRESVINYYIQFSSQILNGNVLPCAVASTQFNDIQNVAVFLQYLMENGTFCEECDSDESFTSLGLIVTADENLHSLSDGKGVISSNSWNLFPNSKHSFIHNDLRMCYPTRSSYLCSFNSIIRFWYIQCIIQENYQQFSEVINPTLIKSVLNCLANDPAFSVHCNEILHQFALLPASNNKLYSLKSDILPLINISKTTSVFYHALHYDLEKVKSLMIKFKAPLLQHELVGNILDKIKPQLPSVWNPQDILKTLYLIRNEITLKLTEQDLFILFTVFKQNAYHSNKDNQKYIRHLPVFTTISGELVTLSSGTMVFIWDDQEACKAGITQWISHVPRNVKFLSPDAPWACIRNEAKFLQICQINRYDVYRRFIFPYFSLLEPDVQMAHLEFIKQKIYPNCTDLSAFGYLFSEIEHCSIKSFVSTFKTLCCIPDGSGDLCTIGTFYDHNNEMFSLFCNESSFLPNKFRAQEWLTFFKFFGLKMVPTVEEYVSYCLKLPRLGNNFTIERASLVLLNALLCSPEEGVDDYKDLKSKECTRKVSNIPIAVVEEIEELHDIKAQKMGEQMHLVNDGERIIYLTKLSGSSTVDNKYLLWTVKPLIKLPSGPASQQLKDCGVVQSPLLEDVILNLKSLSSTSFANESRFEKHDVGSKAAKSDLLPNVVVAMIKYIHKVSTEKQCSSEAVCKKYDLSNTTFLPVKLLATDPKSYVLVKPVQVLYTKSSYPMYLKPPSIPDSSKLDQLYPFLHPLIEEAYGVIDFLVYAGVQDSLNFSHIQLILQLAKNKCQDSRVNINIRRVIVKATDELVTLLQSSEKRSVAAQYLKPLYLLSQDDKLVECSKLIVYDIAGNQQLPTPTGYAYLNPLKDGNQIKGKLLSDLLPKELRMKSLKSMLEHDIIDSEVAEEDDVSPNVSIIGDILRSEQFKQGIELLARSYSFGIIPSSVTKILKVFQQGLSIKYFNKLRVQPRIRVGNEIISLHNTINDRLYLLQKSTGQKWMLSLQNTISDKYPPEFFADLASELCSRLQLKSINCFEFSNSKNLDVVMFVSLMLQRPSIPKVVELIHSKVPDSHNSDLYASPETIAVPKLGDAVATCWHHRLDQNILNLFRSQEWVGYENQNGAIVYAQILYEIDQDTTAQMVNDFHEMMQRKFLITTGNDSLIEVSVLELYKFIQESTKKTPVNQNTDVEIYRSHNNSKQVQHLTDYEGIKAAVKAAFALSPEKQNKVIKRLYLQYHPDKNPDNPNATAQFQFLVEEIKRAEKDHKGSNTYETERRKTYSSDHEPTTPQCSSLFSQWDQTASSHNIFRSRDVKRTTQKEASTFNRMNIPTPGIDIEAAKIWIKQAEYDHAALSILVTSLENYEKVSAAACFMSHEVAEKSLKAGMYAKCGVGQVSLNNHNLSLPANALAQLGCPSVVSDAIYLERFYLDTRFPNRFIPLAVPGEKFNNATAIKAFEAADRILKAMKQMI